MLRNRTALGLFGAYLVHLTGSSPRGRPDLPTYLQGRYGRRGLATTYLPHTWSAALHPAKTALTAGVGGHSRASGHQAPSLESMELYIESSQAEFDSHLYNTHLYNTHQRQLDPFLRRWVPATTYLPRGRCGRPRRASTYLPGPEPVRWTTPSENNSNAVWCPCGNR